MKTPAIIRNLLLILLAGFIFSSCEKDNEESILIKGSAVEVNPIIVDEGAVVSVDLIAGQHIIAGKVSVSFDKTNLYVTYNSTNGWYLREVHLWVGPDLAEMPVNNAGNPQVGKFPYKAENLEGSDLYTFTIPWNDFGGYDSICGKVMFAAAHAAMYKPNGDGTIDEETGWGNGYPVTDHGNWAMYFAIRLICNGSNNEGPGECETAFAYGSMTFTDANLTRERWGWINIFFSTGSYIRPLYAGAGQNDTAKATLVGSVSYLYSGASISVMFDVFEGYTLSETHVYASSSMPQTIAPGLYGNTHENPRPDHDEYTISLNGFIPVYVIAHAVVCSELPVPE